MLTLPDQLEISTPERREREDPLFHFALRFRIREDLDVEEVEERLLKIGE